MAKAKTPVVTADRKNRLREMLSSRNVMERDNSGMMQASNRLRMSKGKKGKGL